MQQVKKQGELCLNNLKPIVATTYQT